MRCRMTAMIATGRRGEGQAPPALLAGSRTGENNGIAGRVSPVMARDDQTGSETQIQPAPAGAISVAHGGSVLSTFVQEEPFYTGFHVAYLVPKSPEITIQEKLWYVEAIKAHRFRFSYGRQANKQLPKLRTDLVSLAA